MSQSDTTARSSTDKPSHSVTDPIIELKNATVTFDMDRGKSCVLDDVSLSIQRNEILGVVGESGSGKSMLASALMDAIPEPGTLSGEVLFHPQDTGPFDVTELTESQLRSFRWESVSMVFQGAMSSFNPVRKIKTAFVETFVAHNVPVETGLERTREILSDLYLDPDRVLDSYPHELSGGMQQRALIALSLVLNPDVLVMDEPTAALDLLMQQSIISLLNDIKETYDVTIVFITHDLSLISGLVDRIAVMYAFDIIEVGPTMEVLTAPRHPYTRALLKSSPDLTLPLDEMTPIDGRSPDPLSIPHGCSYAPRCPLATDQCREGTPGLSNTQGSHHVDCHYWEDAANAVPIPTPVSTRPDTLSKDAHQTERAGGRRLVSLTDIEVHFGDRSDGLLSRIFPSDPPVRAVDGVSLDVYEEDVLVIVGESGCGKSTLGKTAIGLQEPTAGSVTYRGQDMWDAKRRLGPIDVPWEDIRQRLQIIHQDPGSALNPNRRVGAILGDPLKRWRKEKSGSQRRAIVHTLLEEVGLTPPEDYAQRYPHQLSGGEKQRFALIRAFLSSPELIFADEPVSALDVSLRIEIMNLMIRLQEMFGTSFLFVSHDLANARYIAGRTGGRIAVMYLGEIVEIGPPEQVINNPKHPYTQALRWATPDLISESDDEDAPFFGMDIPDARDVPSGCRYHTRCLYARKTCTEAAPAGTAPTRDGAHDATCFRTVDNHEYWTSEPLEGRSNE